MLEINQKINHPVFGEGIISNIEKRLSPYGTPYDDIITVKFNTPMLTEKENNLSLYDTRPREYREFTSTTIQPYLV